MKKLFRTALLLLATHCAAPAAAQSASGAVAPAGVAPMQAPCSVQVDHTCAAVDAAHPIPVTVTGASGGTVTQGSTTSGQSGMLTQGAVVSGDTSYTAGQTSPITLTATGRVRVGLSSATNLAPGPVGAVNNSDLVACTYRTPVSWTLGWTGAFQCDSAGNVMVSSTQLATIISALGSLLQSGGSIGNTSFIATQVNASSVDLSGTVTLGGTYQTALASSGTRKGCLIQNPTTATEVLSVKVGTMAAPFTLQPGASFSCASGQLVVTDAITVTAATTSHAFSGVSQ